MSAKLPTHVNGTEIHYADDWKESSKFFVHRSGQEIRVGFSDGVSDKNEMPIHSQVSMSLKDAEQLHYLLGQALTQRRGARVRARRRSDTSTLECRMDRAAKLASLSEIHDD